jgi:hypothetical protein
MPTSVLIAVAAIAAALLALLALVLYRELRNQHHMWHDPCVTPQQTRDDIRFVLRSLRRVLSSRGVAWWIDYGTLLGAWRLGESMIFDHDVDISYLGEHRPLVEACRDELLADGIELDMERTSIRFRGRKIGDAEPWWRFGDRLCRDDPAARTGPLRYFRPLVDDFPARHVSPLWSIRLNGEMYPCPNRPAALLRRRYLTCRLHLRLAIPHKQKCWYCGEFWREALHIWRCRTAPLTQPPQPDA